MLAIQDYTIDSHGDIGSGYVAYGFFCSLSDCDNVGLIGFNCGHSVREAAMPALVYALAVGADILDANQYEHLVH